MDGDADVDADGDVVADVDGDVDADGNGPLSGRDGAMFSRSSALSRVRRHSAMLRTGSPLRFFSRT